MNIVYRTGSLRRNTSIYSNSYDLSPSTFQGYQWDIKKVKKSCYAIYASQVSEKVANIFLEDVSFVFNPFLASYTT